MGAGSDAQLGERPLEHRAAQLVARRGRAAGGGGTRRAGSGTSSRWRAARAPSRRSAMSAASIRSTREVAVPGPDVDDEVLRGQRAQAREPAHLAPARGARGRGSTASCAAGSSERPGTLVGTSARAIAVERRPRRCRARRAPALQAEVRVQVRARRRRRRRGRRSCRAARSRRRGSPRRGSCRRRRARRRPR